MSQSLRAFRRERSNRGEPTSIPRSDAISRVSRRSSAAATYCFVGLQATLGQSPPQRRRSTSATLFPWSAVARAAASRAAEPAPSTIRSKWSFAIRGVSLGSGARVTPFGPSCSHVRGLTPDIASVTARLSRGLNCVYEAERKRAAALEAAGGRALVVESAANVRWLLCGRGAPVDVCSTDYTVVLRGDDAFVLFMDIERSRVEAEERLEDLGYELCPFPWHEGKAATVARLVEAAGPLADEAVLDPHRRCLGAEELERYRAAG